VTALNSSITLTWARCLRHRRRGQVRGRGLAAVVVRCTGPGGRADLGGMRGRGRERGRDHHVVLGQVVELGPCSAEQPLLFYRGAGWWPW